MKQTTKRWLASALIAMLVTAALPGVVFAQTAQPAKTQQIQDLLQKIGSEKNRNYSLNDDSLSGAGKHGNGFHGSDYFFQESNVRIETEGKLLRWKIFPDEGKAVAGLTMPPAHPGTPDGMLAPGFYWSNYDTATDKIYGPLNPIPVDDAGSGLTLGEVPNMPGYFYGVRGNTPAEAFAGKSQQIYIWEWVNGSPVRRYKLDIPNMMVDPFTGILMSTDCTVTSDKIICAGTVTGRGIMLENWQSPTATWQLFLNNYADPVSELAFQPYESVFENGGWANGILSSVNIPSPGGIIQKATKVYTFVFMMPNVPNLHGFVHHSGILYPITPGAFDPSSLDMQYLGPDAQQHLVRGDQAKRRRWIAEGFWTPEGPAFQSVVSKMCSIQDVLNLPAEILSNPAVLYQTLVNNFDTPNECGVYPVYMLNPLTDDLDMVYSGGVTMFPSWISEYPYLIWVEVQNKWRPALAYTRAGNQQYDLIATDQWAQPEDVTAYIEEQSLQMVWKNKATLLSALDGCKTTDDYCADLYDKVNSSTPPAN